MSTMLRIILNATNYKSPLLRTVVPSVAAAFALQTAVGLPSALVGTERFFDISGSVTYISCTALSLYLPILRARLASGSAQGAGTLGFSAWMKALSSSSATKAGTNVWDWRQVALSACVGIWALRLGSYLFTRIMKDGGIDSRFDKIRQKPVLLFSVFMAQAAWVSCCLLPIISLNGLPAVAFAKLGAVNASSVIGFSTFIFGLAFEMMADKQKSDWLKAKKEKKHDEDFITSGLWGRSRHPNYFGEITLWAGMSIVAGGALSSQAGLAALGWQGWAWGPVISWTIAAISPAFSALVLIKGTGVPQSEEKYDKRYGDRKDYQKWRHNTPMIIPKIF